MIPAPSAVQGENVSPHSRKATAATKGGRRKSSGNSTEVSAARRQDRRNHDQPDEGAQEQHLQRVHVRAQPAHRQHHDGEPRNGQQHPQDAAQGIRATGAAG